MRRPQRNYRRSGLSAARTLTIQRLVEAHVARTGIEPSDAELALTLAMRRVQP